LDKELLATFIIRSLKNRNFFLNSVVLKGRYMFAVDVSHRRKYESRLVNTLKIW